MYCMHAFGKKKKKKEEEEDTKNDVSISNAREGRQSKMKKKQEETSTQRMAFPESAREGENESNDGGSNRDGFLVV